MLLPFLAYSVKNNTRYWREPKNRKKFFEELAEDMGFNPLNPKNWQGVTIAQIEERKVTFSFLGIVFVDVLFNLF